MIVDIQLRTKVLSFKSFNFPQDFPLIWFLFGLLHPEMLLKTANKTANQYFIMKSYHIRDFVHKSSIFTENLYAKFKLSTIFAPVRGLEKEFFQT